MNYAYKTCALALLGTILLYGSQSLYADIIWNEAVDGDLSNDPLSPTPLNFMNGSNTIIGSLSEPDGDLRDYITFTIGPNQFLTGLYLDNFSPAGFSFHAINSGNTSFIPGGDTAGNFLGLEFVDEQMVGTDMLPGLAAGEWGSTGFTIPLGPGTYCYLIQEISAEEVRDYQIRFQVIPEPSSVGICCLIGLLLNMGRHRRGEEVRILNQKG